MNYSQLILDFWQEDYEYDYVVGESNAMAFGLVHDCDESVVLFGPAKSGKKHLAYTALKKNSIQVYLLSNLTDAQIIKYYDDAKAHAKKVIWVYCDGYTFSADVKSRMNALVKAQINEIDSEMFDVLMLNRFQRLQIKLNNSVMKYIMLHLPKNFAAIDHFFLFAKQNILNIKSIKEYFAKISID